MVLVLIVPHPEAHLLDQRVIIQKAHTCRMVDAFAPADDFLCAMIVDMFQERRERHEVGKGKLQN
jgi:hypothetical protein